MSEIIPVKERLERAIARPLGSTWPTQLHKDAVAEIERLQGLPQFNATPSAFLKMWRRPGESGLCRRVDLHPECEPWLAAYNPTVTPLYGQVPRVPAKLERALTHD